MIDGKRPRHLRPAPLSPALPLTAGGGDVQVRLRGVSSIISTCPSSNALGQSAVFGTEALARLGLRLGGFQLMLQSSQFDGVAFDPFSF